VTFTLAIGLCHCHDDDEVDNDDDDNDDDDLSIVIVFHAAGSSTTEQSSQYNTVIHRETGVLCFAEACTCVCLVYLKCILHDVYTCKHFGNLC